MPEDIHILSSVKGGVGKTLIGLAIICHYSKFATPTIGLDMNTMNPDFSRILSFNGLAVLADKELEDTWQEAMINATTRIIRRQYPYTLHEGATDFWREVSSISNYNILRNHYFIVDTNLHIANLLGKDVEQSFRHIDSLLEVNTTSRNVYIWVLWTWASFQESDTMRQVLRDLWGRYGTKVSVVHVLNPSALVPPSADLRVTEFVRSATYAFGEFIRQLLPSAQQQNWEQISEEIKQTLSSEQGPYKIPGLYELRSQRTRKPISYLEFYKLATKVFTNLPADKAPDKTFEPLYYELRKTGGRPRNVLAISVMDPSLVGYTDTFARNREHIQDLDEIRKRIGIVGEDVSDFLERLVPGPYTDHGQHDNT
jgi:hypothetical protein